MIKLPEIIPPRSIVRLIRSDRSAPSWARQVGRRFRIGYYRPSDGLNCIWLVNDAGEYEQTTDRETLRNFFNIQKLSEETDFFGANQEPLGAFQRGRKATPASKRK